MPEKRLSLSEVEAQRKADEKSARRWYARNAKKLSPEELPRRSGGKTHEFTNAETSLLNDAEQGVVYSEAGKFVPLVGTLPQPGEDGYEEARRALEERFDAAFNGLPERQQELLNGHFVEGLTLRELAVDGESRQAVHERVQWAIKAFRSRYELG